MELDIGINIATEVGISWIAELAGPSSAATVRRISKRPPPLGGGFRSPADPVKYMCLACLLQRDRGK
jgi:hypothetical protein